ncbi:MAG: hypothetical protein QME55_08190 [Brevundimonas sp.]|uniref:hypothetical protein n=1 Tax=Brevundimonas sp. TaxID=1871086 RepID=UPI00260BB79D|nr:hypothetical protein [Brevundimonas sp.]MDI6624695.1 hypothetical protein [Brevundimonas sp.]MDQ7780691.1 hypothetical protein [Planctomycetota bacterium]
MEEPLIGRSLLFAGSDPTDNTITLQLGLDDGRAMRVDLALGVVGPVLAAINAEAMKLNAGLSEEGRLISSSLKASDVWLDQDAEGNPMLVFELANGSLLPLAVKSGDFAGLAAEMALLASVPPGAAH